MKDENLTEEEKQEYLDIIIAESERLAALSTNHTPRYDIVLAEHIISKQCYVILLA